MGVKGSITMGNKQRSIRLPDELWDYIRDLSPEHGSDTNEKLRTLLWKGIKRLEQEQEAIRLMDSGEIRMDSHSSDGVKASNE